MTHEAEKGSPIIDFQNNVVVIPPCSIGENVVLLNCTIGPEVVIEDNCVVKDVCLAYSKVTVGSVICGKK